ncbi:MAG: hypothetical protein WC807_19600 [Hyphomicrobium sp.]|jgi:hypothetical protein
MTSPTPEERAKRADDVPHSYLPLDDRSSHALIEVLCDLMYWADADDLDFTTKVNEAEDLYEKEQSHIVPVPAPYRVEFTVCEQYSVEIVALTPEEAVEAAKMLYATEGPSPVHDFVMTATNTSYWRAEKVES